MKIENILEGWQNFISKSEVVEKLAIQRAEICAKCPHSKKGWLTAFLNDKITKIQGSYCDLCKCPLSAKIRSSKEKCDINKW